NTFAKWPPFPTIKPLSLSGPSIGSSPPALSRPLLRQETVGFRTAIPKELPCTTHLGNHVQVQIGHQELFFVPAGLSNYLAPGVAKITLPVELSDVPRMFVSHAVNGGHEVAVGHSMRGLFELPKIFGQTRDRGRRVENYLRSVQPEDARPFREMPVITDVHAHP